MTSPSPSTPITRLLPSDISVLGSLLNLKEKSAERPGAPSERQLFVGEALAFGKTRLPVLELGEYGAEAGELFRYSFINNPDGSIRWFFPSDLASPLYLTLYNATTIRGRAYKLFARALFPSPGRKWLFSGEFLAQFSPLALLEPWVKGTWRSSHLAIFTGTPGADRKVVAVLGRSSKERVFLKIPLGVSSTALLERERMALQVLAVSNFETFVYPTVTRFDTQGPALALSDVAPAAPKRISKFSRIHIAFLSEIYSKSIARKRVCDTDFFAQIARNIELLKGVPGCFSGLDSEKVSNLSSAIGKTWALIRPELKISTAYAHGDFTPWNTYLQRGRLFIYDWELFHIDAPVLFDYFHFVLQNAILIKHWQPGRILRHLKDQRKSGLLRRLLGGIKLDVNTHFNLYLLHQATHYLPRYMTQKPLHKQAHWLVDLWLEALGSDIT